MPIPQVSDKSDPANKTLAIIALVGLAVMVTLVVFVQQFLIVIDEGRLEHPPASVVANESVGDPGLSEFALSAKMQLKAMHFFDREDGIEPHRVPRDKLDDETNEPILRHIEKLALSRTDRLRFAIIAGDVHGAAYAKELLDKLATELGGSGELAADAEWLRKLYAGSIENPAAGQQLVPEDARQSLVDRHGWFGRVALTYGAGNANPARVQALGGFETVAAYQGILNLLQGLCVLAGLVMLVVGLVYLGQGKLTGSFDAPAVGGAVYLETFVIFLAAFMAMLLLQIPFRGASESGAVAGLVISEMLQWSLLASIAWPLVRGVSWEALKLDLGLHTGEGFFKEVGCGVLGFLCDWGLVLILGWAMAPFAEDHAAGDPEGFPMFEHPLGNSWAVVWIGAIGAVVWAPIYEELVMRGCLYRYLHGKIRWVGAAFVSAAIFGAIHPYDITGLIGVAMGGLIFALLREWRGSLIAPITAHFLWNAQISLSQLLVLSALDS